MCNSLYLYILLRYAYHEFVFLNVLLKTILFEAIKHSFI